MKKLIFSLVFSILAITSLVQVTTFAEEPPKATSVQIDK